MYCFDAFVNMQGEMIRSHIALYITDYKMCFDRVPWLWRNKLGSQICMALSHTALMLKGTADCIDIKSFVI